MAITHEGLETQSVVHDGVITKISRRTFADRSDATSYARDALMYERVLCDQGFVMPQTIGMDTVALTSGGFKLMHTTEYIDGHNLAELAGDWSTKLAASQQAVRMIASAGTLDNTHLVAPLDAKPDNFVRQGDSGEVYFVDILPPLLSESTDGIAYGYSRGGRNSVGRVLINHYINDQSGALTRFGVKTIAEQYGIAAVIRPKSVHETFEQLFATSHDVPNVEKTMARACRKVPSFLGYTALRRSYEIANTIRK